MDFSENKMWLEKILLEKWCDICPLELLWIWNCVKISIIKQHSWFQVENSGGQMTSRDSLERSRRETDGTLWYWETRRAAWFIWRCSTERARKVSQLTHIRTRRHTLPTYATSLFAFCWFRLTFRRKPVPGKQWRVLAALFSDFREHPQLFLHCWLQLAERSHVLWG